MKNLLKEKSLINLSSHICLPAHSQKASHGNSGKLLEYVGFVLMKGTFGLEKALLKSDRYSTGFRFADIKELKRMKLVTY